MPDDPELDLIRRYEPVQRETCRTANASFVAPDYSKTVALDPLIAEGHKLVYGVRHRELGVSSGWFLTADDRPKPPVTEMRFEHLRHLATIREDLLPYLGLPPGWDFVISKDGSWAAWSPSERLEAWVAMFLEGREANSDAASAIVEHIAENFDGTELSTRLGEPLQAWVGRMASPDEVRPLMEWAATWLALRRTNPPGR